ncbi:MAG: 30S ribosomal protein S11 [Candidatus Pacebacteria bacterium]|jgi:small subunit ribosomal protein S11|nr:30S ribosomal protein S11 [Candidatus Paceibacterota bacterium]MBT4652367.1 30S ribosomal protein S11 [Candidatus Paceibacterota bacterium]MBT6756194.1 30S ribosomal protein S11 [Candidatus Paceibacterota bacterium]MBT6921485.1 30S ribosomal protein S11 [Candidatus Paceibacterota bacterium]
MVQRKTKSKKKITRVIKKGKMYVSATFNNTLVSITDEKGAVVSWASTGAAGFSGSRKSTPYAATITVENAVNKAKTFGMNEMDIFIKGPGPGRDVALRVLRAQGIKISMIADTTPIPHNGTRPRKAKHNR